MSRKVWLSWLVGEKVEPQTVTKARLSRSQSHKEHGESAPIILMQRNVDTELIAAAAFTLNFSVDARESRFTLSRNRLARKGRRANGRSR